MLSGKKTNINNRSNNRQAIPLLLKLKRFKSSAFIRGINDFLSKIKPPRRFNGVPGRLLIFRNDRIGDAMVTLPVLRDIKLNYPDTEIDVITSPSNNFIFEEFPYITNIIHLKINGNETGFFYKLPLIGGFTLFMKYLLLPFLFSSDFRIKLKSMHARKYDFAVDMVGLKRNAIAAGYTAGFTAGPGRLLPFLFYDYYSDSNWVTSGDTDFMTRKIEKFFEDSTEIQLKEKNNDTPLLEYQTGIHPAEKKVDILFHFGTSSLRKLDIEKEKQLIREFGEFNIIVTDSIESASFMNLRNEFIEYDNIKFILYDSLKELAKECINSKLLVCYDGGQAHYLSQYIRTIAIFGPGSAALWKPYEFADYEQLISDEHGACAIVSGGEMKHIAIYRSMWCNPCFDTGCKTKPCLGDISAEFISNVIKENCLKQ
jgi:ADP-heptose:LPS heptosyltransferase